MGVFVGPARLVEAEAGAYAENVSIGKDLTLRGATGNPADVIIDPAAGDAVATTAAAATVTLQDLRITGADNALAATGQTTLHLVNLAVDGNTSGGTLSGIATVHLVTSTPGDTVNINANGVAMGQFEVAVAVQPINYASVTTLDVDTLGGDDTVNVAPHATTVIDLDGGPHAAGDTLVYFTDGTPFSFGPATITTVGKADIQHANFENYAVSGSPVIVGSGLDDQLTINATGPDSGQFQLIQDYTGITPIVGPWVSFARRDQLHLQLPGRQRPVHHQQPGRRPVRPDRRRRIQRRGQ